MSTDERDNKANQAKQQAGHFPARYLRFGDFQIDLQLDEIWRAGRRVKVPAKVYRTLMILVARAGEVVTRDEVRKQLWPEDLIGNYDANVNTSMNKVRQLLGDSPERPTYIQTIPRRGYCFVAHVEYAETLEHVAPRLGELDPEVRASHSLVPPSVYTMSLGLRIATLILAGMVVGSILTLAWMSLSRSHKLLNSTDTPVFERFIVQACPITLVESGR